LIASVSRLTTAIGRPGSGVAGITAFLLLSDWFRLRLGGSARVVVTRIDAILDRIALVRSRPMDPLSRVLSLITVCDVRPSRLRTAGEWALRFDGRPQLRFGQVRRGDLWVIDETTGRHHLGPGDCFVLASAGPFVFASDPARAPASGGAVCAYGQDGTAVIGDGDQTCVEGGQLLLDRAGAQLLFGVLAPVTVLPVDDPGTGEVRSALARFFAEADSDRLGASLVAAHLGQLICVAALRATLSDGDPHTRGWLAAFADPLIGAAVQAMHADPRHPWTVAELAEAAHLARSSFSARYRAATGESPLAHVLRLRMRVAARELRTSDRSLVTIAQDLGYSSQAAFSRAFKRATGVTPGQWRAEASG
jgi:AraC-like DNA-binding protein